MNEKDMDLPEFWPRLGVHLFVPGSPGRDAEIAASLDERMYWMKEAFKEAADLLVFHAEEHHYAKKKLVWPIVFCYRQYVELALKEVIAKHGDQVEPKIEPLYRHELGPLWTRCKSVMQEALTEIVVGEVPEIQALECFINEFDTVDAGSYAFRYPTDTKGRTVDFPFESIDLVHLHRIMEGIYTFLDCNREVLNFHLGDRGWI